MELCPFPGKTHVNEPRKLTLQVPLSDQEPQTCPGFSPNHLAPAEGAISLVDNLDKRGNQEEKEDFNVSLFLLV